MAGAYVQNLSSFTNGTNSTTKTITLTVSPTAGNMMTVTINSNGTQTLLSVTDNAGNTWNIRNAGGSTNDSPHVADADVGSVPTTVTVTLSAATAQWCVSIDEWSGVTTSQYNPSVFAEASGSASPVSVTPAAAAPVLAIGFEGHHTGATPASTFTQTGSYTKDHQTNKASGQFDSVVVSHDATGILHSFTGTLNNSPVGWDAIVIGYGSSGIALQANLALVVSDGGAASERVRMQGGLASVNSTGLGAALRGHMQSALGIVSSAGFPATESGGIGERFKNGIWTPVSEKALAKWRGVGRNSD